MPRPGPRPYECVKRAWHSDRHQPMRGSIIQQIFRVVHENHSAITKKNREWQEKLPIVVFKAEEIMYSKANSEAEYMDLSSLWDRINDAINTIIRRDESSESGKFLPPCVEAALNLGCVAVRASRSQRHSTQRSYLSPRSQEQPSKTHLALESNKNSMQNNTIPIATHNFPPPYENHHHVTPIDTNHPPNFRSNSIYPLYYGTHFPLSPPNLETPKNIIVGTPIFQSISPIDRTGCFQNGSSNSRENLGETHRETGCDLSLDLGLSLGNSMNKEFSFFPLRSNANDSFNFTLNSGVEGEKFEEEGVRKRKAPFFFQSESSSNYCSDQIKRPGL